jgi:hypothetical protein
MRRLAWFDADAARQQIDGDVDQQLDRLITAYTQGVQNAVQQFRDS